MNKILLMAGIATTLFVAHANAAELNPYVGAKLKRADMSIDLFNDESWNVDDKVLGGSLALGISQKVQNGAIRAELEYSKNKDAEKSYGMVDLDYGIYFDGKFEISTQSVMTNVYYDIDTGTRFTPYIGAGLGYAEIKGSLTASIPGYGSVDAGSIKANRFVWNVGLGAAMAVNDHVSLDVGYRYVDYGKFTKDEVDVDMSSHEAYIGIRYNF